MTPAGTRVCAVRDVPPDRAVACSVASAPAGGPAPRPNLSPVCVAADAAHGYVALLDRCPHRDQQLSGGLVRDGTLVCPGHFWRFDLRTGRRTDSPERAATVYPTRVVDGYVEALLPPAPPAVSLREWLLIQARREKATMSSAPVTTVPEIAQSIDVDGIATNYHDVGDGPPVLLIHGSGPGVSAWANWRVTMPALAEHHRVIAPDVLGFGYTERSADTVYDLDTWARHMLGFLDALELGWVSVVGNSFGGALALALATRAPHRVDRMVLMGSVGVPFDITPALDAVWGFEPSLEAMRSLLGVFAYDSSLITNDLAQLRLTAATRPGVQEAYASMFPAPRQAAVNALLVDEGLISALPTQTLIVHGRDDKVIPLTTSLRLTELIDNSRLHVFGRCGHWVQLEKAAEFNRLVSDFLE